MTVYAFGGYIKLHAKKTRVPGFVYILLSILVTFLNLGFAAMCEALGRTSEFWADKAQYFYSEEKLPIVLISVFLFLGFLKTEIKQNTFINLVASASFGVYLVHNNDLAKKVLWDAVTIYGKDLAGGLFILFSIGVIAAVYAASTVIELCRIYVIEKRYEGGIKKLGDRINKGLNKIK
jgi:surface polysaccharide O-acyltransferase-like enzyme